MYRKYLLLLILFLPAAVFAQSAAFDPHYSFRHSGSTVQDKNFYFLTLMEQLPVIDSLVSNDEAFHQYLQEQKKALQQSPESCHDIDCLVKAFYWTPANIKTMGRELDKLYNDHPTAFESLINNMRASGYFYRYQKMADTAMLSHAWEDAAKGINYIIKAYTTNKDLIYPQIDSTTFAVNGQHYGLIVKESLQVINHRKDAMQLFFQPSLKLAMALLFDNYRDEAARFEPMDSTNGEAYRRISHIDWDAYPYSVILIPGEGPENNRSISVLGKYRCQLGAEQYRAGKAPFIVVSGGFVHPFQTPFCEANEMRKYLINELHIPASAIIMEPHARHTTTNIRNINRILYRQGFPVNKPVLCTSTPSQVNYILSENLKKRCQQLMDYVPYSDMQRIDEFDLQFLPVKESLQMDVRDPLDP